MMKLWPSALVSSGVLLALVSCAPPPLEARQADPAPAIAAASSVVTPASTAEVERGVRAFMLAVAADVTNKGAQAWEGAFADGGSFFMAANGRLVFPDRAAARVAIVGLANAIQRIELQWGSDLRVDVLTPAMAVVAVPYHEVRIGRDGSRVDESGYLTGVVERRGDRWYFRDAHWSAAAPAPPVP